MSLPVTLDRIEVSPVGIINARFAKMGGGWHRVSFHPGGDISSRLEMLNRHLITGLGYPAVSSADVRRIRKFANAAWSGNGRMNGAVLTKKGVDAFLASVNATNSSRALSIVQNDAQTIVRIDPATTALLVIDFWNVDFGPVGGPSWLSAQRVVSLVQLARAHGIHVVHAIHEGASVGLYPGLLPLPTGEGMLPETGRLETYFASVGLKPKMVLVAGFGVEECVLFTRDSSMNELARRNVPFDFALVKNATAGSYLGYQAAIKGIETVYASTTIGDIAAAFGAADPSVPVVSTPDMWERPYALDGALGLGLSASATALVLFNITDDWPDEAWRARVSANLEANVTPLLAFARTKGMHVIFVSDRPVDPVVGPLHGEAVVYSAREFAAELAVRSVSTALYAGNLTNSRGPLSTIDVWGFTKRLPYAVNTRMLEDALIVEEAAETLNGEKFKHVFVERATSYGGDAHRVSTAGILMENMQ